MTHARTSQHRPSYAVSHPHDPAETQADRAADAVTRGESVRGWSFERVPARALHRDGPTDDPKPKEGSAGDVVEALAETPVGKQVIEKVKERPDVKAVLKAIDTPGGKVAAGGAVAAGLAGFAAAGKPLPAQIPGIPVGTIGGYDAKAKLTIEGPVDAPTFVGVTLSFSGAKSDAKGNSKSQYAAETAKLRADAERFRDPRDRAAQEQWVRDYVVAQQSQRLRGFLLPLRTGDRPKTPETPDAPVAEPGAEEPKKKDEEPVQREPDPAADRSAAGPDARRGHRSRPVGRHRWTAARPRHPAHDGGQVRPRLRPGTGARRARGRCRRRVPRGAGVHRPRRAHRLRRRPAPAAHGAGPSPHRPRAGARRPAAWVGRTVTMRATATATPTATRSRAPAPPPLPELLQRLAEETVHAATGPPTTSGWSYGDVAVHTEPAVSRPSDSAEREAEAVADRVAAGRPAFPGRSPSTRLTRAAPLARDTDDPEPAAFPGPPESGEQEPGDGHVEPDLADDPWPDPAQQEQNEEQRTQTSETAAQPEVPASRDGGPGQAPPGFSAALASGGTGTAVPQPARTRLESAFGRSFAGVRLHRDARSDSLSRSIGARAFTWGSDIHLAAGAPSSRTPAGLRLLAHELTHVVQGGGRRAEVRRAEALYFSTLGKQGYFRYAARFHADHGFPAPVRVSSVEEMLEHLVTLPVGLTRVRLVSHAVPSGVFLPLLRGGGTSLFRSDLRVQSQSGLEGELATEHSTVGRSDQEITVEHHVAPRAWAARLYQRLSTDATWARFRTDAGLPATLASGGDLETYLWWVLDRAMLTTQEPTGRQVRGTPQLRHVLGLPAADRAAKVASLDRTIALYADLIRQHLVARAPGTLSRRQKEQRAEQTLTDLRGRIDATAPDLVRTTVQAGGYQPAPISGPTPRYESIQGALERGTYANNLLTMKSRLPDGMPLEIRGCRIGQNQPWLDAFRVFWGLGVGAPPAGRHPDVTAPDLRHIFGLRPVGPRRQRRLVSDEWLEGPRGRRIYGGTPDFDQHLVHAR